MLRRFSINFALFSIGIDALLISLSLYAASYLRPVFSFLPYAADVRKPMDVPGFLFPAFPFVWIVIFNLMSVYDGRRNLRIYDELSSVFLGSALAAVSLAGLLYLSYRDLSRILFLVFVIVATLELASWRLLARLFFRLAKERAIAQRNVLIIGAGPVGMEFYEKISGHTYLGFRIAGFLDDDDQKRQQGIEILGKVSDVKSVVLREKIDDVVIALPPRADEKINNIVSDLLDQPVKVLIIPDYYNQALHKARFEEFAGIPMLDVRAPALSDYQRLVKRAFDLAVGILVLPVSLFIMGVIALGIWLEGPGPILFRQKRVGENGKYFEMLKFRTMVTNAEELRHIVEKFDEEGKLIHKHATDPRVTRFGRLLRRTSLDELPQLFNVIKGDMSLIGPRPELPYLVDRYEPWQRIRFSVPQGITGWWQVNGRSDKPMHLHTEDDLFYVQNYSLFLDLHILIKTIGIVVRGKGAF